MKRKNTNELEYFYNKKKWLIELITFVGVIATLFLQITHFEHNSLKMLQATLLIIFSLLISYLLISFWTFLILNKPETRTRIIINGMIISAFIFAFIFNLFKFLYEAFNNELFFYLGYIRIGIILLVGIYLEKISTFFTKKFGKEKIWIFLAEFIWILAIGSLWVFPVNYFQNEFINHPKIFIGLNLLLIFLINILYAYKKISKKTFYILMVIVVIIIMLICILFKNL